jgi:hypothetical protein
MDGAELIADGLGRINRVLHRTLEGVPTETLCKLPTADTNSMAWLAWHLTRVEDHHMSDLAGLPQLWTSAKWHQRFGMAEDDKETGTGHTPEQVAALKADAELLLAYTDSVYQRGLEYLKNIRPETLDEEINEPQYDPLPTVGVRLMSILGDNIQHAGQIAYVKGMLQGTGWLGV